MTNQVFVCVDVLTYLHSDAEPVKQRRAKEWLELLGREKRGRTSMPELAELYLFLRVKSVPMLPPRAWSEVVAFMAWKPVALDEALMTRAYHAGRAYKLAWRESLMVAAAQLQDCRVLLTEELRDGTTYAGVRVRDPFLHKVEEPVAEYRLAA
jgi:predicted nucleic acid-binding protein